MAKYLISLLILGSLFAGAIAFAHDALPAEATVDEAVAMDDVVESHELEIMEPSLLPDSPFYFLKNWAREIKAFFAFDPSRKAELRLRFADEKIIEMKKLVEKNATADKIKKGVENYQKAVEKVAKESKKAGETEPQGPKTNNFFDKLIKHQILHQKILQKLEDQVPAGVFVNIKAARNNHLEKFAEVMQKLEDKEKIGERIEKSLEALKGSEFNQFKNLELLMDLGEKVPEEARESLRRAQENALQRLKEKLEAMSPEDQAEFKEYMEKISMSKERKMEVIENLRSELVANPQLRERLLETRETILKKFTEKKEKNCPAWTAPAEKFCKDGRVVIEKSAAGCPLNTKCIVPGEFGKPKIGNGSVFCITLWDPVCGKDGRTYSSECFANASEIEIADKGECSKSR